ncbi:hypothetical protein QNI22_34340 [Cytophagaceae bacterium BD1B2-1]|uniref:Uncharacterized protein n=1 Tax=Xanthocytophaga agilis TaxID=3048010 RepID=A0AAE3UJD9_9BACT|nr:hypothetical protein [Xanthocytophaga agilis]
MIRHKIIISASRARGWGWSGNNWSGSRQRLLQIIVGHKAKRSSLEACNWWLAFGQPVPD